MSTQGLSAQKSIGSVNSVGIEKLVFCAWQGKKRRSCLTLLPVQNKYKQIKSSSQDLSAPVPLQYDNYYFTCEKTKYKCLRNENWWERQTYMLQDQMGEKYWTFDYMLASLHWYFPLPNIFALYLENWRKTNIKTRFENETCYFKY